jgi:BirA family biotin operon repressor/biotin-[acetyl-CoA-carboxylase] ligase
MLTEPMLEEIAARVNLTAPVRFDEVTDSTNAACAALAERGAPEWTLVAAGHQTRGRGRLDRRWVDRPGHALLCSVLLRPPIPADRAGVIPLLAGVAAASAARAAAAVEARCKWPNDVVVDGRKAGGILAEASVEGTRVRHVVVGVGLNVGPPPEDVDGAGSIPRASPSAILEAFLAELRRRYRPRDASFCRDVVASWRALSATLGRRVRATTLGAGTVEGVAVDLDERGGLVVATDDGLEATVAFGDVEHLAVGG